MGQAYEKHTHIHTHTHTHIYTHTHTYTHTHIHTHTYTHTHTHIHIHMHNRNIWPTANQYKHMAQRHAYSQPIETYGLAPHNRNIWPHNSRATVFCLRFWPILLSVLLAVVYPLLTMPPLALNSPVHPIQVFSLARNCLTGSTPNNLKGVKAYCILISSLPNRPSQCCINPCHGSYKLRASN